MGPLWASAYEGALELPAPIGVNRARRINLHLLNAVGRTVGQGFAARTGAQVMRALRLARRRVAGALGLAERTARDAEKTRTKRYWESLC